ncbi:hypothetical protein PZ897_10175 [Hoeflea sp. YIM 152468]|uniref:hypothetical protein n=1 Tax=Hoeflea sp. YIM 152468 TaxID=3031759 RepID=UPI0023DAA0F3|nr:hypothetical protein [Hoeflea sp. YIM 152468]MDF1608541.1 hypothetical protein [Hoeflea sp. YIM 152468]
MTTETSALPMHGPLQPASTPIPEAGLAHPSSQTASAPLMQEPAPLALDLVELDLALDLNDIAELGFCAAVRAAATRVDGEFLFDLPASGLAEGAQRIAVVCLSRDDGGRFGLVLLSANGDQAITAEADETTAGLVQFAKAFVAVLEKF